MSWKIGPIMIIVVSWKFDSSILCSIAQNKVKILIIVVGLMYSDIAMILSIVSFLTLSIITFDGVIKRGSL